MHKHQKSHLLSEFSEENHLDKGVLACWFKEQENFKLYVFTAMLEETEQLEKYWQLLNDYIAINFQPNLEIEVEIWNIYLVFLTKNAVSKKLKYKIEQDKFSCRKLVFDNFSTKKWQSFLEDDFKVADFISNRLFDIKLVKQATVNELTLQEILQNEHSNLIKIINSDITKVTHKAVFDKFLKSL